MSELVPKGPDVDPKAARDGSSTYSPVKAGPEMAALRRFLVDCTWSGAVEENGMGPGSPRMEAVGRGSGTWIIGGLWKACDFEQDFVMGDQVVFTWRAHMVIGWDVTVQEYRACVADSNGGIGLYAGKIDGNTFTLQSMGDTKVWGQPARLRFTWNVSKPRAMTWRNEWSINNGPWALVEEYVMTPCE